MTMTTTTMMMTSATMMSGSMTMTEEELARHDSRTLLQLLLSADARCDALTAQLESTLKDRRLILEERDRTFALMLARAEKAEAELDRLRALPAVQPVMESGHWKDHCRTNNGPDICDEPCRKCLAKPPFSHSVVQPDAHVNEAPKSEHEALVMLAPDAAVFRGPA